MTRLIVLILLLAPSLAEATTFYVGKSGSDANPCATAQSSTAGNRKLTIASGLSCLTASAGDTLIIGDGTYVESLDDAVPSGGGTDATRTIVKCENARACTLDASFWAWRFVDSNTSWITIQDMKVCCGISTLVALHSSGTTWPHHIRIQNNEIYSNTSSNCVYTGHGQFNEFLNNTIHDCWTVGFYALSRDSVFRGNEVHTTGLGGVGGQSALLQFTTSSGLTASNNLVEENVFRNGPTQCIVFGAVGGQIIRRNVFRSCVTGLSIETGTGSTSNTDIDQNTFYGNGTGIRISAAGTNNRCRNNLAVGNTTNISITGTCTQTDNLTTGTVTDIWVDPANGDLRLKAGSVAIDGGTDIGLAYNGSAPDQGAFEVPRCISAEVGLVDATSLILTCESNVQPPLLPASGLTGFSVTEDAAPVTVSSCARSGDTVIDCTLGASISNGTTVLVSYTPGNVTASDLVGNSYNQGMMAFSNLAVTNHVGEGAPTAVLTQTTFRFHGLRGTEAAPVVKPYSSAGDGTNLSVIPGAKFRLRLKVACTVADCAALGMALRYSKNGGAYTAIPDNFDADKIKFYGTSPDPDIPSSGTATTELLTSSHVTNVACAIIRAANSVPTVDLSQDSETECEYALQLDTDVSAGDTYDFRLYNQSGGALSVYSATPRLTVTAMQAGSGF
jgi:hypothetical protein